MTARVPATDCRGKVRFATRAEAQKALRGLARKKGHAARRHAPMQRRPMSAYPCGVCGGYHIGHTPRRRKGDAGGGVGAVASRPSAAGETVELILLSALRAGSAEAAALARDFGLTVREVLETLQHLALRDLVDAHEAPAPCGPECMRWFVLPRAEGRVAQMLRAVEGARA